MSRLVVRKLLLDQVAVLGPVGEDRHDHEFEAAAQQVGTEGLHVLLGSMHGVAVYWQAIYGVSIGREGKFKIRSTKSERG